MFSQIQARQGRADASRLYRDQPSETTYVALCLAYDVETEGRPLTAEETARTTRDASRMYKAGEFGRSLPITPLMQP